jgi:diaminopimelate epimerase
LESISFSKFHGYGNDYIVIERELLLDGVEVSELARLICNRHTGAGSDGIAVVARLDSDEADFACEIVNPDGSIAGFSGNGTRCAVAYLHHNGLWTDRILRLRTLSGVKRYELLSSDGGHYEFRAEIGKPKFSSVDIPVSADPPIDPVIDCEFIHNDVATLVSAVNVGNPVGCIFVDDFDLDWRSLGRTLEIHPLFPDRANIVFVRVIDSKNIEIRIWERGAGETSASGTCSSAAAVMCARTGRTGRMLFVHSPGGTAEFVWHDDNEMILTGTADLVYTGNFRCDD